MQRYTLAKFAMSAPKSAIPVYQVTSRSMRTPMIKFLGKRDLAAAGAAAAATTPGSTSTAAATPSGSAKPLSPNCELAYDTDHDVYARRITISEEECDMINNGGPESVPDWTKITL